MDDFPLDASESKDSDGDQLGDNADNCPFDANSDQANNDLDERGDVCDLDDDNDGFSDEEEAIDGTDPFSSLSCREGCFSFDIDENKEAKALSDGLLVIPHLFGFSGSSLVSGATSSEGSRTSAEEISGYLSEADSQLDIDGDGESKALTDGLLLIRYLFGFTGDSLLRGLWARRPNGIRLRKSKRISPRGCLRNDERGFSDGWAGLLVVFGRRNRIWKHILLNKIRGKSDE